MSTIDYNESELKNMTRQVPNTSGLYIAFDYEELSRQIVNPLRGYLLKVTKRANTVGTLNVRVYNHRPSNYPPMYSVDDFVVDKYRLFSHIKWDGTNIVFSNRQLDVKKIKTTKEELDEVFKNLPQVPEGLDGWWKIK